MPEQPGYLRAREIAERVNLSVRTVRRCIADGSLRSVKVRGARLVSEADLNRFLNQS
jgi:excisionase family DNA binding protein